MKVYFGRVNNDFLGRNGSLGGRQGGSFREFLCSHWKGGRIDAGTMAYELEGLERERGPRRLGNNRGNKRQKWLFFDENKKRKNS